MADFDIDIGFDVVRALDMDLVPVPRTLPIGQFASRPGAARLSGRFSTRYKTSAGMTTIRICNESEARLMIKEGSLIEYVEKWAALYPQQSILNSAKRIHGAFGLGLIDSLPIARLNEAEKAVLLEIGDRVAVLKKNNELAVYGKAKGIWIRLSEGLGALGEEGVLEERLIFTAPLFTEDAVRGAKSADVLAEKAVERMQRCPGWKYSFGDHEVWEWNHRSGNIIVYTHSVEGAVFNLARGDVAKHIRRYMETYKMPFGAF